MSSPGESADPASAPPAVFESQASSPEPPSGVQRDVQSTEPESPGAPPRKTSIRIGTQRYGSKAPPAVAKPVLASPRPLPSGPAESAASSDPSVETPTATPPIVVFPDVASAATTEPVMTVTATMDTAPVPPPAQKRPPKPQGSNKSRAPQRIHEPVHVQKVAPPSTRGELSPDLEMEFLAALGNQPIDEIIAVGKTDAPVDELAPESRHKGRVISVHRDNVFVEIGPAHQGVVPLRTFATPPEPGAILDMMISRFNAAEGLYELALPGAAIDVGDWSEVAEGMIVEARVTGHNKGGLECDVNRLRGFIPASQISMFRVEDLAQFVDQKLACVVTEANAEKRNLVLSHRAVLERERAEAKQKLMSELEVGQVREATVRSLQAFGAFVDLGGVDGLIHISQLSWDRIRHASEVLEVSQKVKVKIQKIDPQTGKIGLAFRDLAENPWTNAARDFPSRSRVRGTVSRLMEFGAFVRLAPGIEGLIHVSELSHKRVFRVADVLNEGQEVEVLVLSVDPEQQRISLSLKALEARAADKTKSEEEPPEVETAPAPAKKRASPLKGGTGGPATGERFGLKW
jgi:predicted RNA-binding protein with RPS1 domain